MTFRRARAVLEASVVGEVAPAISAVVIARGEVVLATYHGTDARRGEPGGTPIGPEHRFDLASLTKVIATGTLAALLVDRGSLDVDAPVSQWLPRFTGPKARITARQVLAHAAGFPSVAHGPGGDVEGWLAAIPLESRPGARMRYCDPGFITMGLVVERICGASLDVAFEEQVAEPFGLSRTLFIPSRDPAPAAALRTELPLVPTERANRRGDVRRGVPDDDAARDLGGVAGHAGLFSTAADVAALGQHWLAALGGRSRLLSRRTAELFTTRDETPGSSRALAWDLPSGDQPAIGSRFGRGPRGAFGHPGFTGTSLWIDVDAQVVCALLSNHCPSPGDTSRIRPFRRAFHDAVAEELGL
ncbi:MAG TPA: serine hydrolase domain-containing protein [Anaeromyxobacteraceae bacterium]|nr:serine hydrolase domain-containing protein [Anaeromyxobacteraceae bacterium]